MCAARHPHFMPRDDGSNQAQIEINSRPKASLGWQRGRDVLVVGYADRFGHALIQRFAGTHKTNLSYGRVFRGPMLAALILVSPRRSPPALAGDGNGSQSAAAPALGIIVERKHIRISPFDPRRGAPVGLASQAAREFRLPCAACVRPQNEDPCGCGFLREPVNIARACGRPARYHTGIGAGGNRAQGLRPNAAGKTDHSQHANQNETTRS
jgi:hypothetical protein